MFKNKKRVNVIAMLLIMVTVLSSLGIASFAAEKVYKSEGTTKFFNRIAIGGKGHSFKAASSKAKLKMSVMPETRAVTDKGHVYQVYVDDRGQEYVKGHQAYDRYVKENKVNSVSMTFDQAIGKKYRYVITIKPITYDSQTGRIYEWPDARKKMVKYEFVITSLKLEY